MAKNGDVSYTYQCYNQLHTGTPEACKKKGLSDDILDAVCLAVTANLDAQGRTEIIPENPSTDDKGLKMHMAEDVLYLELGTALNMNKEQVLEYIIKEIEKDNKEQ